VAKLCSSVAAGAALASFGSEIRETAAIAATNEPAILVFIEIIGEASFHRQYSGSSDFCEKT
jgi:hypothetical protein